MKISIISILVILQSICYSQDCLNLVKKNVDRFTDKISLSLKSPIIKQKGKEILFQMDINQDNEGVQTLLLVSKDPTLGCIEQYAPINFIFTDGTKAEFQNSSSYSCKGIVIIFLNQYFEANKVLKEYLRTKTIEDIRIVGTDSYYEVTLTKIEAEKFRNGAKCILE